MVIDSRSRTYNPHPYLGLYDGYACFRLEPYLATDTLLFQLGNINQKRTKIKRLMVKAQQISSLYTIIGLD